MDEQTKRLVEIAVKNAEKNCDFRFLEVNDGFARTEMMVTPKHKNGLGIVYGGLLYHMADLTCGGAYLSAGGYGPTVSGDMQFINSVGDETRIICEARVVKCGRSMGFVQADIFGENRKIFARGTYEFFNGPKPSEF